MSTADIRIIGAPVLRQKAAPVEAFDAELRQIAEEMFAIMFAAEGIGLAAPQVDVAKAFLVIGMPRDEQEPERLFFGNPVILESRGESNFEEGCLSIPNVRETVMRPEWIRLQYQDLEGGKHDLETDGLLARILQHEIDHLNGILFVDRISPAKKLLHKKAIKKLMAQSSKPEAA